MNMVKPILDYQAKERVKLDLLSRVNGGKAKHELDEAIRARETASGTVKSLASEAETLLGLFDSVAKNLSDVFKKLGTYKASIKIGDEEAAANDMTFVSGLLSKVSGYESQLSDIASKSASIKVVYEKALSSAKRAAEIIASASAKYEKENKETAPKIAAIDAELKKLAASVEPALLEKYKQVRKQTSKGDIVVPIEGNRCGGCRFELPLSMIHTVTGKGYIICEECGKIIYKA